jgi:hypothetical protein
LPPNMPPAAASTNPGATPDRVRPGNDIFSAGKPSLKGHLR